MRIRRLFLFASLPTAVILGALAMLPPGPRVTKANFDRIQHGMTFDEVKEILGADSAIVPNCYIYSGTEESRKRFLEELRRTTMTQAWLGKDGAYGEVRFVNGVVRVKRRWIDPTETIWERVRRTLHLPEKVSGPFLPPPHTPRELSARRGSKASGRNQTYRDNGPTVNTSNRDGFGPDSDSSILFMANERFTVPNNPVIPNPQRLIQVGFVQYVQFTQIYGIYRAALNTARVRYFPTLQGRSIQGMLFLDANAGQVFYSMTPQGLVTGDPTLPTNTIAAWDSPRGLWPKRVGSPALYLTNAVETQLFTVDVAANVIGSSDYWGESWAQWGNDLSGSWNGEAWQFAAGSGVTAPAQWAPEEMPAKMDTTLPIGNSVAAANTWGWFPI